MALYQITKPAYVDGQHLGPSASLANPVTIEVPNDVVPSVHWTPLNEEALKAHQNAVDLTVEKRCFGLDPDKEKGKISAITAATRKEFAKSIAKQPATKPAPREISTMQDMAAAPGGKIVGRASDKSPV